MLTVSDLEVNLLEFRQRTFQFEKVVAEGSRRFAVFARTETESERRFRPQLLHLRVVLPLEWVVLDEASDVLCVARDGSTVPSRPAEEVVEVGAEPPSFREQGIAWQRIPGPSGTVLYVPEELAEEFRGEAGRRLLGDL